MKHIGCKIITMPPRAQNPVDISVAFLLTASLLLKYIVCSEHETLADEFLSRASVDRNPQVHKLHLKSLNPQSKYLLRNHLRRSLYNNLRTPMASNRGKRRQTISSHHRRSHIPRTALRPTSASVHMASLQVLVFLACTTVRLHRDGDIHRQPKGSLIHRPANSIHPRCSPLDQVDRNRLNQGRLHSPPRHLRSLIKR